jgi:multidrug efflux system membrane fusion protein
MNDHSQDASQGGIREARPWRSLAAAALLLAVIVAILSLWRASRGGTQDHAPAGPIDVVATVLAAEPAPVSLEALGNLRAVREVTLASEVAGRVAALAFDSGQRVRAGALLIQLDDSIERADLAAAEAGAAFAQQQLARATELAGTGATSKEVLQQRQSERDQSAAQVMQLQARIRQKSIRAPFSGDLGLRRVDLGQYLDAGDSVVTITDMDRLYVNFDVPQQQLFRIQVGQQVEVRSDTPGAEPQWARINAIEPQVGRDTRNATIQAVLPNTKRTLHPGMYVTVAVSLPAEPDSLLVPASAIVTSSSGDAALVVRGASAEQSGKANFVPIKTSRRIGDRVVVIDGLKAGDVVVTEGQLRIQPGADVRVVKRPATAAVSTSGAESAGAASITDRS